MNANRPQLFRALLIAGGVALAVVATGLGVSARPSGEGPPITILSEALVPDAKQSQVLADGFVSDAEMRQTLERVVKCVSDNGYEAELVEFKPEEGRWVLGTRGETEEIADAADAAMTECRSTVAAAVMHQYTTERTP